MDAELHTLTIAQAAQLTETKQLSPVELTNALNARIDAIDPQLDAFITRTQELASQQARTAESEIVAGRYRGALHGIPVGLKDIYNTKGILTSGHSRTAIDNIPAEDATTTRLLYEAGAVLMGKLATHEFAHGGPSFDLPWPPARNPWDREHFTGGSSSGSGAAVASGMVLGALGSDTGGSIRGPATLCGVAGLKPTYGLVSRTGVIPNSYSFDHCGPLTWTAEDAAIMLQALAGYDPRDPGSVDVPVPDYRAALTGDVRGLRIGVVRHFYENDLPATDETRRALDAAFDVFRGLGATVEDVRLAPLADYSDVKIVIAESELFSVHRAKLTTVPGDFGADFLSRALPAVMFDAIDYVEAQRRRRQLVDMMKDVYARFDVLLTAGNPGPASRLDAHLTVSFWEKPNYTSPSDVTGDPAISVCCGFSASGLPLGLQIAGRPFAETTVLRAAHAYEQATPWRDHKADVQSGPKPVDPIPHLPTPAITLDTRTQDFVEARARSAGLTLDERQLAFLCEGAPLALAMAQRIRASGPYRWEEDLSSVFYLQRPTDK